MALKIMVKKRRGELTTAKEIVETTGSPFDATARVLQRMTQGGILKSEHGAHGGYVLIRDLSDLSLHELTQLLLGPVKAAKCLQASGECELKNRCNIHSPISVLNRKQEDFYRGLMLGELLMEPTPVWRDHEVRA